MADSKKYYYLKLKDNFYDSESMILLESMENGYLYANILMKMYLRSLKADGKLMYNDKIPYNPQMLSKILRHNVDVVSKAIEIFKELDLIEILDNGAIYMLDIQNYIGLSSSEGDRKRIYRKKIEEEKIKIGQMSDERTPEIELKKDKEIELKIDIVDAYCKNIHSITPIELQKIEKWEETFTDDIIIKAIEIAVSNNARNIGYIEAILRSWKNKGYKTLSDIENENKKGNEPTWFKQEFKKEEINDEDKKELEELMKRYN